MKARHALVLLALLGAVALSLAPTAAAHKTAYTSDGKVKIVWGFLNEPAVTWTKTGLDLVLTDNATGAAISGAESTVEVHLKRGEQEIHLEDLRAQFGRPGAYSQPITLTKPGLYALVLHGKINDTDVDMTIEAAHEVEAIEETFFPALEESPYAAGGADGARIAALEAKVAALEARAKTASETPTDVTAQTAPVPDLALALALALVVAIALARRRA